MIGRHTDANLQQLEGRAGRIGLWTGARTVCVVGSSSYMCRAESKRIDSSKSSPEMSKQRLADLSQDVRQFAIGYGNNGAKHGLRQRLSLTCCADRGSDKPKV